MKKNILLTLLFIVLIMSALYFKEHTLDLFPKNDNVTYKIERIELTKSLPDLQVDGYMPLISNVDPRINSHISDVINKMIIDKSNESTENKKAQKEQGFTDSTKGTLSIEPLPPKESDPYIISFMLRVTGFTGGAHGFLYYIPFNFDRKTGETLTRDQLLAMKNIKLDTLASIARVTLRTEMQKKLSQYSIDIENEDGEEGIMKQKNGEVAIDEVMFNEGTDTKIENYNNILVGKNSLDIYFEPYAVASWAEGEFIITLPYSQFPEIN